MALDRDERRAIVPRGGGPPHHRRVHAHAILTGPRPRSSTPPRLGSLRLDSDDVDRRVAGRALEGAYPTIHEPSHRARPWGPRTDVSTPRSGGERLPPCLRHRGLARRIRSATGASRMRSCVFWSCASRIAGRSTGALPGPAPISCSQAQAAVFVSGASLVGCCRSSPERHYAKHSVRFAPAFDTELGQRGGANATASNATSMQA